jgi:molecular chaperone DnaK
MKAEELLPAVEAALGAGLAVGSEREEIEQAAAAVRAAMAGGGANVLKAAVQRLDGATEALAARLVEQALDAAVERRF